jgi:catechol 2,3-dioxygenase-like lactoylglutathione lyase family enzyme
MRFAHLGIVARDADKLAAFYRTVFGCKDIRPPRTLSGEKVSRGNGVPNSEIYSIWLTLPGVERPFLEIHEYSEITNRPSPHVNDPGYAHITFEVDDIRATRDAIIRAGGGDQGQIEELGAADATFLAVYMRDPEGNVIELEES